ncbi:unnamed protein product [Cuscuta campestris]|uniref:Uncharacterized protein n=1 Tax=Cuscuta campestris TaxID=132261 RepID=A0A484NIU7_9ASTE|nr:unnamed protein product [Cuscuta campestris]
MIAAQELSEFLQMEIRLKFEEEVLEFYRNGEFKTAHSKKNPQKTFPVIKSTLGGTKVKLSQKKLGEKLRLPNSGVEVGKFPVKNLDWNIIGISVQVPSGPAKKADLNNDYKLVLELVIACLECGSGGHADDITQERAFIINSLITKTKVNWAAHFFKSISKHLGKHNQKYLCQGLYIGHILESMGAAVKGKNQLQLKEINKVKEQIASVTVSLQKQMSLLQMDIRSALAVASANQVVTKDYLKVIIDNQKEAYKLFRLIGANSGNRKMEVILQQHSPSPIPQLPIAVKEGEVSYIPSHLNLTNLILEAQQRNPENSAQLLSSSGLDGTEFIGTVVDHFSNDAQSEERRENLRRIKELCGNMKGISEVAGSSKRKRN